MLLKPAGYPAKRAQSVELRGVDATVAERWRDLNPPGLVEVRSDSESAGRGFWWRVNSLALLALLVVFKVSYNWVFLDEPRQVVTTREEYVAQYSDRQGFRYFQGGWGRDLVVTGTCANMGGDTGGIVTLTAMRDRVTADPGPGSPTIPCDGERYSVTLSHLEPTTHLLRFETTGAVSDWRLAVASKEVVTTRVPLPVSPAAVVFPLLDTGLCLLMLISFWRLRMILMTVLLSGPVAFFLYSCWEVWAQAAL
jgi:hypothetical protein